MIFEWKMVREEGGSTEMVEESLYIELASPRRYFVELNQLRLRPDVTRR